MRKASAPMRDLLLEPFLRRTSQKGQQTLGIKDNVSLLFKALAQSLSRLSRESKSRETQSDNRAHGLQIAQGV